MTDDPGDFIFVVRSHYIDSHETDCDDILVIVSKTMTCILRHDNPTGDQSWKVSCVNKKI